MRDSVEQEIWWDFKRLSEPQDLERYSNRVAKEHFGISYSDNESLIYQGAIKKLEYDEDLKINKFLANCDFNNIDWEELEKLYPNHNPIKLPESANVNPPARFRTHDERRKIGIILLEQWENKKIKLYSKIPNESSAKDYLVDMRWSGHIPISPFDENSKVYECSGHKYKCKTTGKYFNARTNTIFDNTKLTLLKWYEAIYLLTSLSTRKISTHQLAHTLGITQKTAWEMANKVNSKIADDIICKIKMDLFKPNPSI